MPQLVTDCPRCGAKEHTFNVRYTHPLGLKNNHHGSRRFNYEAFCVCNRCLKSTVFVLRQQHEVEDRLFDDSAKLIQYIGTLNRIVDVIDYIKLRNMDARKAPENISNERIAELFREGSESVTGNCPNAAVAMFRSCIDLATKSILEKLGDVDIKEGVKQNLKQRLDWLFENGKLDQDLKPLSNCIREYGNDAVHEGTIDSEDAEEIMEFCFLLLNKLYTEPARIKAAEEKQKTRKKKGKSDK